MSDPSPPSPAVEPSEGRDRPFIAVPQTLIKRVQASLQQTLNRYSAASPGHTSPLAATQFQAQLANVSKNLAKLEKGIVRVAVFGLVSRGKSSVINALVQQDVFQTGPLHGVTKWPRSVYWEPANNQSNLRVELIDTPGIDEVNGAIRAEMAQEVAQEADLVLFVLAGDITAVEQDALTYLLAQHKPLIVVCNKMDRYPDFDAIAVLERLGIGTTAAFTPSDPTQRSPEPVAWPLTVTNVVQVAAAPDPIQVRVEWPDGRFREEWETPPAQMEALEQRLYQILQEEGWLLVALNALRDSQTAEASLAATTVQACNAQADDLLWQFAKWKSVAVAANPVAIADIAAGMMVDLVMIRALAQLYQLPMTGYEAGKLWQAIAWSGTGLLLGEMGTSVLWGMGKSAALLTGPFGGIAAYSTTAIAQAALAGYGSYRVGKAAQAYLQQGCTWGPDGASTVMQSIVATMDKRAILARLSSDLLNQATTSDTDP